MHKYVRLLWVVFLVSGYYDAVSARSATNSQYQQMNGVTNTAGHKATEEAQDMKNTADTSTNSIWKDLSLIYKIYQQCATVNLSVCLKVKLLTGLERISRTAKTLHIVDGIQFMSNVDKPIESTKVLSEQDIEATLPRAYDAKDFVLNNMIFKKISTFLQDHTLQIKFPDIRNADNFESNDIEGRKKKDKKGGGGAYIMIPLLLGGTFVPIAYGALAMLAGKALIVSKLALVLASIIGIKKLLSGGAKESSHEVVVSSGSNSGWGRDMDLAYHGWKQTNKELNNRNQ